MASPRVRIADPAGTRACGGAGGEWIMAVDAAGAVPWLADIAALADRFGSPESSALYRAEVAHLMRSASKGRLPSDLVVQMSIAPDVLELKLPDWEFADGHLHVRLYYSEPADLPGHLVGLRLRSKRPGRAGKEEQNTDAVAASDLLLQFQQRGFR